MDPKKIAQLLTLLSPDLARALLQSLEVIPKLERENQELRQTLEANTVELNRVNDRRIEAEAKVKALVAELGSWTQANQEIATLKDKLEAALSREAEQIEQTDKARRDRDLATEDYARCREAACEAVRLIDDDKAASARGVLAAELLK